MKKYRFIVMVFIMVGLWAVPAISQKLQFPKQPTEFSWSNLEEKIYEPIKARKDFSEAFKKEDYATMDKLIEDYPGIDFLSLLIKKGEYRNNLYPICTAIEQGNNKMVAYMLKKKPEWLYLWCENNYPRETLLEMAIRHNRVDMALMLLDLGVPANDREPLVKVAMFMNDKASLQEIIPALLDKGADYNALERRMDGAFPLMDAFFTAASSSRTYVGVNKNFIVVLRDELRKRGVTDLVSVVIWRKYGPIDRNERERFEKEMQERMEGRLLARYGIRVHGEVEEMYAGD